MVRQLIEWAMDGRGAVSFQEIGEGDIGISIHYMTDGGNLIPITLEVSAKNRGMGIFMKKMAQNLVQWIENYNFNDYVIRKVRETEIITDVRALLEDMDQAREDLKRAAWRMTHLLYDTVHGLDAIYGEQGPYPKEDSLIHVVSRRRAHQFLEAWLAWEEKRIWKCPTGQEPVKTRLMYRNKEDGTWGAMDNSHGDCWVEEFPSPWDALDYLFGQSPDEIQKHG